MIAVNVCAEMIVQPRMLVSIPTDKLLAKSLTFTVPNKKNTCSPTNMSVQCWLKAATSQVG